MGYNFCTVNVVSINVLFVLIKQTVVTTSELELYDYFDIHCKAIAPSVTIALLIVKVKSKEFS